MQPINIYCTYIIELSMDSAGKFNGFPDNLF